MSGYPSTGHANNRGIENQNLSVNNIYLQMHFAERDDASREMIEREEAAIELLIAHQ